MRFWPFRRETRADSSYTDALVAAITANAKGEQTAFPTATAALEACSGLVGRVFASASVKAPDHVQSALTPALLALVGRSLIRRGEVLFDIAVRDGAMAFHPVSSHDVDGPHDAWHYRINLAGPSEHVTVERPASGVLHFQYAMDAETPWRGVGPLQVAALAGRLSAETVAALADEASGPRGAVMPLPVDGNDPTIAALKADIRKLAGKLAFVESTRGKWSTDSAREGQRDDWLAKRIGADPPASLVALQQRASEEVMLACGLSPSLFSAQGDGTSKRESFRQALHSVIGPLGRLVAAELSLKLETEVALDFADIHAADVTGRARAWRSLVGNEAKLDAATAARLVGLGGDDA